MPISGPVHVVQERALAGPELLLRQVRLDLATLPTGAYLVEVTLANGQVERRQAVKN